MGSVTEMETGTIFDIKRYAVHDGPGIRTTVFFKGCPLSCLWCHNPEGISSANELMLRSSRCVGSRECLAACAAGAITFPGKKPLINRDKCTLCGDCADACPSGALELVGKKVTVGELMLEIEKDRIFFEESGGGVTFSGGEPLAQPAFLKACLKACREKDISTALDTSGFVPYEVIEELKKDVDLFLYDIKMIDEHRHIHYTGVSNKVILDNLEKLSKDGSRILIRIPLIPEINATKECLSRITAFLAAHSSLHEVSLLPYHAIAAQKYERLQKPNQMKNVSPLFQKKIQEIKKMMEDSGLHIKIGS